ncbi:FAD:protein FMN transferase [Bifidobacterium stellenboschense]|nr:FAD:protein FMN transferase [Bifidobacterium stellenboschense]
MTSLAERMPHTMAFPRALGTGIIVQSAKEIDDGRYEEVSPNPDVVAMLDASVRSGTGIDGLLSNLSLTDLMASPGVYDEIDEFIDQYESALSRFRTGSLVSRMRRAEHGGAFTFPDWAGPLFDLYDLLCEATDGAIDPCVGEDLIRLGYDARYSFTLFPGTSGGALGAIHGRPTWREDVTRTGDHGTTLVTRRPVSLDFGACGKGYLVDLIAARLAAISDFVIDAGGDLLLDSPVPVAIALEDPSDDSRAVGTANVTRGAFCASAPSRRRWTATTPDERTTVTVHHLLNAIDGLPVDDVAATWVSVPAADTDTDHDSRKTDGTAAHPAPAALRAYPTALADGLATALFVADPNTLHARLAALHPGLTFECAVLKADRTAVVSGGFPGTLFTA